VKAISGVCRTNYLNVLHFPAKIKWHKASAQQKVNTQIARVPQENLRMRLCWKKKYQIVITERFRFDYHYLELV
jgi:hypothetical protein